MDRVYHSLQQPAVEVDFHKWRWFAYEYFLTLCDGWHLPYANPQPFPKLATVPQCIGEMEKWGWGNREVSVCTKKPSRIVWECLDSGSSGVGCGWEEGYGTVLGNLLGGGGLYNLAPLPDDTMWAESPLLLPPCLPCRDGRHSLELCTQTFHFLNICFSFVDYILFI